VVFYSPQVYGQERGPKYDDLLDMKEAKQRLGEGMLEKGHFHQELQPKSKRVEGRNIIGLEYRSGKKKNKKVPGRKAGKKGPVRFLDEKKTFRGTKKEEKRAEGNQPVPA